jgi:hypothetical protein
MIGKNIVTTEKTGNFAMPTKVNRGYFLIIMTSGTATIALGGGDGEIPIGEQQYYEPLVAPTGAITITSTGTYVIAEG